MTHRLTDHLELTDFTEWNQRLYWKACERVERRKVPWQRPSWYVTKVCFRALTEASVAEVVVAPPFVYLDFVKNLIRPDIEVGGQNCYSEQKGAFTGEVSADQLKV